MRSSQRWLFMTLALGLVLVFGYLAFLLLNSPSASTSALPTLVALNTLSPTEANLIPAENTALASLEAIQVETSATAEIFASPTLLSPTEANPLPSLTSLPASATTIPATSLPASPSVLNSPVPSATTVGIVPINTLVPSATASPTNTQAANITAAPATATLDSTGLIAFNQATNIGVGELRVLSMSVPADEVILSLGGNLPTIQPNQQWVLVELFLICPTETNCAPATTNFSLRSGANQVYPPTPLAIESAFGSLILGNQVLGHLAYVLPRNENPFALELSLGGQSYRFALQ